MRGIDYSNPRLQRALCKLYRVDYTCFPVYELPEWCVNQPAADDDTEESTSRPNDDVDLNQEFAARCPGVTNERGGCGSAGFVRICVEIIGVDNVDGVEGLDFRTGRRRAFCGGLPGEVPGEPGLPILFVPRGSSGQALPILQGRHSRHPRPEMLQFGRTRGRPHAPRMFLGAQIL